MSDYYDSVYRQVIRKLKEEYIRPYDKTEEKIQDFSCAILTRLGRNNQIEYDVVKLREFYCGRIEQRTVL